MKEDALPSFHFLNLLTPIRSCGVAGAYPAVFEEQFGITYLPIKHLFGLWRTLGCLEKTST